MTKCTQPFHKRVFDRSLIAVSNIFTFFGIFILMSLMLVFIVALLPVFAVAELIKKH